MLRTCLTGLAASCLFGTAAHATILTFDIDNNQPNAVLAMNQAYGDNVAVLVQGNATYGVGAEGFTPDIVTAYAGGAAGANLTRWTTSYGDLVNILENEDDGDTLLQVKFTAQNGKQIRLYGFDLAGWPTTDYTIPNVSVQGAANNLFSQNNVLVQGDGVGPQHTTFNFVGGLFGGSSLTINISLAGLGGNSDNIGIDNIRFGQEDPRVGVIPEPGAWAMMILGFAATGAVLRRRRVAIA